ncbi:MAG: 4-(cytidine 5'-diphospho)-2-C-methyl-D-erythritol kinase [Gemmatimonadota bacterium]
MTAGPLRLAAHAKLNLFLRVLAKEDDGFHGLETLFVRLALADELEAERVERRGVTIDVIGADVGPPEQNLAVRAAQMVLAATGDRFGIHLRLHKRIPVQAGLGGGSSDGAAALRLANALCHNAVPQHELFQFARRLGADVPFLFSEAPLALAWGHGERLLRLPPLPKAAALLVIPPVGVATAEAYRWVDVARQGAGQRGAVALEVGTLTNWSDVARLAGNDFESPVFARVPEIRAAFEAVVNTRPLICRMSGSGSTIFGIYRNARERDDAVMMLGRKYGRVIETETV